MDISDLSKGNGIGVVQPELIKVTPDRSMGATNFRVKEARVSSLRKAGGDETSNVGSA
jgi:hypothetical protein